jgi:2-polyprenyl-6-methoxyphenol hydroxylase-like FAD-dependent oxidoreductase
MTARATRVANAGVAADFSYTCRPYAGPGHFLVGDAATFIDPIFSTGVTLGMVSGAEAVASLAAIDAGGDARRVRARYDRFVADSSGALFRLVRMYYRPAFRDLFLHGYGPLSMHRAVLSILAGHVFPRPSFALRWRFRAFQAAMAIHERIPIVPRRAGFSLLDAPAVPASEVLAS